MANSKETDIKKDIFFLTVNCDRISQDQINEIAGMTRNKLTKTWKEIPQGDSIVTFKGIVSQNYAKGEKSRNNYKYDQTGWDFSDYMHNPTILWQHDSYYGGIGHAIEFWLDDGKNLNALFYVDLETLEPRNAAQVKKWFVSGISTGARTLEYMFEDAETGEMLSETDAEEKYGWENVWKALVWWGSDFITLVITKAKMVENSLVTIGSNEKALAVANSIGNSFQERAEEYKNLKNGSNPANLLSPNSTSMNTQEIKKDTTTDDEPGASAAATPEAEAGTQGESEAGAATGGEAATESDTNSVQLSEVDTLRNSIEKMKLDHASEIATVKKDYEDKLTLELNKIRADERAGLAKVVAEQNNETAKSDVKTPEQFKNKYIPQK